MQTGKTVTCGVVLRVTDTKETDRILTVLTADRGKIPLDVYKRKRPTFTFRVENSVGQLAGNTSSQRICFLSAPSVRMRRIFSDSVVRKPVYLSLIHI